MITVHSEKYGLVQVKPLPVIWGSEIFKNTYHAKNTIMIDDIRRNFLMNPAQVTQLYFRYPPPAFFPWHFPFFID